jgi:small conductance mechanosensitive channel
MSDGIRAAGTEMVALVMQYGLSVLGAIAILIFGWLAAGWCSRAAGHALDRMERVDLTLRRFIASLIRYLVLTLTGIAVLSQFGVQTASLITVIGAAGLAIGLALQGTLANVAAGVMLLLLRPFKIGDYVEVAGHGGTVTAVSLFVVELTTPDNVQITVPNSQVWGAAVKNYSHNATRRVDLAIGIAYEDDIGRAMAAIQDVIAQDQRSHGEPAPLVAVSGLGESSVDLVVRVWCQAGDYWPLRFDLTRAIKERLDADGITIPYPQRVLHMAAGAVGPSC